MKEITRAPRGRKKYLTLTCVNTSDQKTTNKKLNACEPTKTGLDGQFQCADISC